MEARFSALVATIVVLALAVGATMGYTYSSQKISTVIDTKTITATKSFNSTISLIQTATTTQTIASTVIVSTTILQTQTSESTTTTTSTSISCSISAEGTGSYVTVLTDSGQPIQGVQVSGILITQINNGGTCQQNIDTFFTNSTGTAQIGPNAASYYLLSIPYQDRNYTATAPIDPFQSTYVTLKVPSGNVSISEIPYGGCLRNATATICPG